MKNCGNKKVLYIIIDISRNKVLEWNLVLGLIENDIVENDIVIKGKFIVNAISTKPSSNTQHEILEHFFRIFLVEHSKGVWVV